MATAANTQLAILNRALQINGIGASGRLATLTDDTKEQAAVNLVYDPLRTAELRRNIWTFAIERQVLRSVDTTAATIDKDVTFPTYGVGDTYALNDIVQSTASSAIYYKSLTASNVGNAVTDTANWVEWYGPLVATYYDSDVVYYPGEILYSGTEEWLIIAKTAAGATLVDGTEYHDLTGTGAVTVASTTALGPLSGRTYAFNLPRDFLRLAPDDPSYLFERKEWLIEAGRILTDRPGPIFLRYVADLTDPTKFDRMFSEGLSSKIAIATCEELTQSQSKIKTAAALYGTAIGDARLVNAIEAGPVEHEEDDFIAVRR